MTRLFLTAALLALGTTDALAQTDVTAVRNPSAGTTSTAQVTTSGSGRRIKTATAQSGTKATRGKHRSTRSSGTGGAGRTDNNRGSYQATNRQ